MILGPVQPFQKAQQEREGRLLSEARPVMILGCVLIGGDMASAGYQGKRGISEQKLLVKRTGFCFGPL